MRETVKYSFVVRFGEASRTTNRNFRAAGPKNPPSGGFLTDAPLPVCVDVLRGDDIADPHLAWSKGVVFPGIAVREEVDVLVAALLGDLNHRAAHLDVAVGVLWVDHHQGHIGLCSYGPVLQAPRG